MARAFLLFLCPTGQQFHESDTLSHTLCTAYELSCTYVIFQAFLYIPCISSQFVSQQKKNFTAVKTNRF